MKDKHIEILGRLRSQLAISDAKIRSDPIPHLQEAYRLVAESRKVIEDVSWILSGADSFDAIQDIAPTIHPVAFNAEALLRINRARDLIYDFLNKKDNNV